MNSAKDADRLRAEVCKLCGFSEGDVANAVLDGGETYIKEYLGELADYTPELIKSEEFWTWWRQVWLNHDRGFYSSLMNRPKWFRNLKEKGELWATYVEFHLHNSRTMTPNSLVMRSFDRLLNPSPTPSACGTSPKGGQKG